MGCFSYKLYRLLQTPHSFSVTIFTLGFRLFFILLQINNNFFLPLSDQICSSGGMSSKRAKGSVGGGEAGKKAKTTPDAGEKSVSEKSQATRTCRNPFEKSKSKQTEFFVREVKDKRMTKNGPEFLIGWRDFPLERDDTWEPISNLTGSEHMICEFQKQYALDYEMKTAAVLKQVADRKKAVNEKNASTALDKTADDIQEARDDNACDDAEEEDDEEEEHGEGRAASGVQRKRRQERSFYFTTEAVKRMHSDPLMWWKQHQEEFPRLARMARQYLAVPASSESPERLFTSVGLVKSDLRGRLLDTTLIDVMWAKQAP